MHPHIMNCEMSLWASVSGLAKLTVRHSGHEHDNNLIRPLEIGHQGFTYKQSMLCNYTHVD